MADRRYTEPKCPFLLRDSHVETDGSVKGKITGTMLGAILGKSPFSSPFAVACDLLGVGREDLDGKTAVEIGKYLEPKLIDYCAERYSDIGSFVKADDVFEKREGDHANWPSDWEDDLFSGHLDGVVVKGDGNYVLEVKTTGNIGSWEDGVPEHYLLQVALYNHFMYNQDKAYVILGIVDDETRRDMSSWTPSDDNVMLFEVAMDEDATVAALNTAEQWYEDYISKDMTPDFDPLVEKDVDIWNHLLAISATDSEIQADLDTLEALSAELASKKEELAPLEEQVKALEKKVKDYMISSQKMEIQTTSKAMRGVLTRSERTSIDRKLMVQAGIDPEPFTVRTAVNSFSFKKSKE